MTRYLILGVVNAIFGAVLYVLYREGMVQQAIANDIMYIIPSMGAIFVLGMMMMFFNLENAHWCSETLIVLGFMGTLLGIWTSFTGVDPKQVGDISAIATVLAVLMQGLGAALWTTITGSFLALWLNACTRVMGG